MRYSIREKNVINPIFFLSFLVSHELSFLFFSFLSSTHKLASRKISDIILARHSSRHLKNSRQPYAVSRSAGHQTSAESWGAGLVVSRISRVPGGGTHRAGQSVYGNMCCGGRMFAPTKIWHRWHRRSQLTRNGMPWFLPSPPLQCLPLSWPAATGSSLSCKSPV